MQLILASGSPRRRELLALFGHPFTVHPADIDETMDPGKKPYDEVARLSREKALAVPREEGDAVIAAAGSWESPGRRRRQRRCWASCPAGPTRS